MTKITLHTPTTVYSLSYSTIDPPHYKAFLTPEEIGLEDVSPGGYHAKLPVGEYQLEEVIARDPDTTSGTRVWWLLSGSNWGAWKETWEMEEGNGRLTILEDQEATSNYIPVGKIPLEEFVKQQYGRDMSRDLGRGRIARILFDITRNAFVEEIYQNSEEDGRSYLLNDTILGYLPTGAVFDSFGISILHLGK